MCFTDGWMMKLQNRMWLCWFPRMSDLKMHPSFFSSVCSASRVLKLRVTPYIRTTKATEQPTVLSAKAVWYSNYHDYATISVEFIIVVLHSAVILVSLAVCGSLRCLDRLVCCCLQWSVVLGRLHKRGLCCRPLSVCLFVCPYICLSICHVREFCQNE